MSNEVLRFDFTFCPTVQQTKQKHPEYEIRINGLLVSTGFAIPGSDGLFRTSVTHILPEGQSNNVSVTLLNKDSTDTICEGDRIVDDLQLHITKLAVDGIDLGHLIHNKSKYVIDSPIEYKGALHKEIPGHTCLSWNGTWSLSFDSPFYLWLLDSL